MNYGIAPHDSTIPEILVAMSYSQIERNVTVNISVEINITLLAPLAETKSLCRNTVRIETGSLRTAIEPNNR